MQVELKSVLWVAALLLPGMAQPILAADLPGANTAKPPGMPAAPPVSAIAVKCDPVVTSMSSPTHGIIKRGESLTLDGKCLGEQAGVVSALWSKEAPAPASGNTTKLEIVSWNGNRIVAKMPAGTKGVRYQGIKLSAVTAQQREVVLSPEIGRLKYEPVYIPVVLDGSGLIGVHTDVDIAELGGAITTVEARTGKHWSIPSLPGSSSPPLRSASTCDTTVCVDHVHNGGVLGLWFYQGTSVKDLITLSDPPGSSNDEPEEKRGRIVSCSFTQSYGGVDYALIANWESYTGKKINAERAAPPQLVQCSDKQVKVWAGLGSVGSRVWYKLKITVNGIE